MPSAIKLTPVVAPVAIRCPHCREPVATVETHAAFAADGLDWIEDRAELPVADILNDRQKGMPYLVAAGGAESLCCGKPYFVIEATFARDIISSDSYFLDLLFRRLGERPKPVFFSASLDSLTWLVARFDTGYGPILEHTFGPYATTPMPFTTQLLSGVWDELMALQIDSYVAFVTGKIRPSA
jgi:hypothetical protein